MNQQQPDNFFREKLNKYQKPAPQGAWNKIESALEKKTEPKFFWWKIAAVFLLVAGAGYVLWNDNTNSGPPPLAQAEQQPLKDTDHLDKPKIPEKSSQANRDNLAGDNLKKDKAGKTGVVRQQQQPKKVDREPIREVQDDELVVPAKIVQGEHDRLAQEVPLEAVSPTVERENPAEARSTVTLTFTSEETSQYLNKNALAEATSNEKKPSNLKKLLQKANDLKSNQDPFGDLRERKNEILALSFKTDKRGQNK